MLGSWPDFRYTSAKIAAMAISVQLSTNMKNMINDIKQRDKEVEEVKRRQVFKSVTVQKDFFNDNFL